MGRPKIGNTFEYTKTFESMIQFENTLPKMDFHTDGLSLKRNPIVKYAKRTVKLLTIIGHTKLENV